MPLTVNKKLGRDADRRKESGCSIEQTHASLFSHVREMAEIPRHQVVDLMERRHRDMDRICHKFTVKDAAGNVTVRENGDLVGEFQAFERLDYLEICGAVRFLDAFEFTMDEQRRVDLILGQFVFEPSDRKITAKRVA